jgi:hypothetical protein
LRHLLKPSALTTPLRGLPSLARQMPKTPSMAFSGYASFRNMCFIVQSPQLSPCWSTTPLTGVNCNKQKAKSNTKIDWLAGGCRITAAVIE